MKQSASKSRAIIQVQGFSAAYGGRTVLKDLTFEINQGEVFIIGGGSGCGKSTVLKHIIGLYDPAAGNCGPAPGGDATIWVDSSKHKRDIGGRPSRPRWSAGLAPGPNRCSLPTFPPGR